MRFLFVVANSPSVRHQQSNGLPLPSDGVIPGEYYEEPPTDHLVLLANQILTTLRDIILTRYRRGRGLREIFHHFDRDNKGYFNTDDFIQATSDLSIETSEKVAIICIKQIGIDSIQYVTYGEFVTFVLDSDHHLLQNHVQEQIATLLEKQGKEYSYWIVDVFQNEEETLNSNSKNYTNSHYQNGFLISKNAFLSSLKKIGLNLTNSEFQRLIDRFDVYGNDYCSVERFMKMIQYSKAWKHSEVVLQYQEQAIQEANYLREQKKQYFSQNDINNGNEKFMINGTEITDELINMCEYLGICILSEQNMIWIAADALRAPLPVNWSAQKDSSGKTYFYNHLTNQSQWEHPLDPHFRNLRDKYRQSTEDVDIERTSNSNALPSLNASNKLHSNKQTKVSSLFEKPPPKYHNSEVEQQVFNKYNYLHNPSGGLPVPGEVFADSPPAINQQQKKHSNANTRPASALPEKITITFGNPKENPKITDARNSNGFNSDLSSNTSSKNRPVSAPTFLPPRINLPTSPNEDSANNQSNHGSQQRSQAQNNHQPHHHSQQNQQQSKNNTSNHVHHQQQQQQNNSKNGKHGTQVFDFLQQNKAIVEAVYSAPYLKAPNTHQNYQDTTHIPNRHYHNPSYHMKKDDALLMSNMLNSSNTTSASNMNQTSSTIASGNYYQQQTPQHQQQQGSKPENLSNTMSSNTGPSKLSSNQKKSGNTTTTMSAVDRALSIGKNSQQILQERDQLYGMPSSNYLPPANGSNGNNGANNLNPKKRTAKLNEMLDGNILEKLDHVIAHKR
jgi:Ca2+-binding EF-hand superfamily protein